MKEVPIAMMSEKELEQMDFFVKINMWLVENYREDLFKKFGIEITSKLGTSGGFESVKKITEMFHKIYDEENKKYPLHWYEYGFGR